MAGEEGRADNNQLDSELLCERGGFDEALLIARYGGLPFTNCGGNTMQIGKTIRLCRAKKGWTQAELSKRTNITVPHLSMMESGDRDPTMDSLKSLANAFDLPLNVFVFLASEPEELVGLSDELKEKLSRAALHLLGLPNSGNLF